MVGGVGSRSPFGRSLAAEKGGISDESLMRLGGGGEEFGLIDLA